MSAHDTIPPATSIGRYVYLRETPYGDLDVVLSDQGRKEFPSIDAIRLRYGNRPALLALLVDHAERGWELMAPDELGTPALFPILARGIVRDANRRIVALDAAYCYSEFPAADEINELHRRGFLEFRGVA